MSDYEIANCMKDIMICLRDNSYSGEIGIDELKLNHTYSQPILNAAIKALLVNQYVFGTKNEGNNEISYLLSGLTSKGQKFLEG